MRGKTKLILLLLDRKKQVLMLKDPENRTKIWDRKIRHKSLEGLNPKCIIIIYLRMHTSVPIIYGFIYEPQHNCEVVL